MHNNQHSHFIVFSMKFCFYEGPRWIPIPFLWKSYTAAPKFFKNTALSGFSLKKTYIGIYSDKKYCFGAFSAELALYFPDNVYCSYIVASYRLKARKMLKCPFESFWIKVVDFYKMRNGTKHFKLWIESERCLKKTFVLF